jgi:hypothetical protein
MSQEDRSRTSVREIRCEDRLWQTFEQISEEQDKSVEELVSDAMTAYAQIAGYETAVEVETPLAPPTATPPPSQSAARGLRSQPYLPPAPPARYGRPTATTAKPGVTGLAAPPTWPDALSAGSMVYLMFDSQKYRIDKDQFIIGRGTKSSDLPIKDGNISRKHAAVIRRNGTFFIKDLGSTNGIDFNGMRIDNKRIDEGDVFHICEYELKFTYKR